MGGLPRRFQPAGDGGCDDGGIVGIAQVILLNQDRANAALL